MKKLIPLIFCAALVIVTSCGPQQAPDATTKEHRHDHRYGQAHDHSDQAPHHGVQAPFQLGQAKVGVLELKLHDDKGDLELWLTVDDAGKVPFDLPLDAVITASFPKLEKTVELRVRNAEKNEDEDGKPNIRGGKSNYFIFPGATGADPAFLVGKAFASEVLLTFSTDGKSYATEAFMLRPHQH